MQPATAAGAIEEATTLLPRVRAALATVQTSAQREELQHAVKTKKKCFFFSLS